MRPCFCFVSKPMLILVLSFLFIQIQSLTGYTTLAYSSPSTIVIIPSNPPATQYTARSYSSGLSQISEAGWIWAGYGNEANCPMSITIQDQITVTCIIQPLILYASADNSFTSSFFNWTSSGNSWGSPVSLSVVPSANTCNQAISFTVTASNEGGGGCQGGNTAALIYGVIQNSTCCKNNTLYYDATTCQCDSCSKLFVGCLTCSTSACLTCDTTNNFVSSGTGCACTANTYVLNNSVCVTCDQFLSNCTLCTSQTSCTQCSTGSKLNSSNLCEPCEVGCLDCSSTECLSCDATKGFSLDNGECVCPTSYGVGTSTCQLCSTLIENCTSCKSSSYCFACQSGSVVNSNNVCQLCPIECLTCDSVSGCLSCSFGYTISGTSCVSYCGDGVLAPSSNEECDDGNMINDDGCSDSCLIQQNFTCTVQSQKSVCSYTNSFRLYVRWVRKQYYQNTIQVSLGIKPNLTILQNLNFTSAIRIQTPSLIDLNYAYYLNGTISLKYNFTETLEAQQFNLIFDPASTSSSFSLVPSTTIPIEMTVNSNIPITYYKKSQYQNTNYIRWIFIIIIPAIYLFMLLGTFVSEKSTAISSIFVFQVLGLSTATINKITPIQSELSFLNMVNGYNLISPTDNKRVPDRINALHYQTDISQNFNLSLIGIFVIGLVLPVFLYLLSFVVKKHKQTIQNIALRLSKQYSLCVVLFLALDAGFSGGLQILYGNGTLLNYLIQGASILAVGSTFIAFLFLERSQYGQFSFLLKRSSQSQIYFVLSLLYRFSLGGVLSIFNESPYVVNYALFLSIFFLIYQLSVRPFKAGYHNYVFIFHQIIVVLILDVKLFYRGFRNNYPIEETSLVLIPGLVEVALAELCSLACIAITTKKIYLKLFSNKNRRVKLLPNKLNEITHQDQMPNIISQRLN